MDGWMNATGLQLSPCPLAHPTPHPLFGKHAFIETRDRTQYREIRRRIAFPLAAIAADSDSP